MIALVHFVYAIRYRFEEVFCSSFCNLQHIVSQWWYRELTPHFLKCILFTNTNEFYRSFYIPLINWPVKFEINTTIHWSRVTPSISCMFRSPLLTPFNDNILNTIVKTHFRRDRMVTISDGILKYIFLNENIWILNHISFKHIPCGLIENMSALVQIMAWCRTGD